MLNIMNVKDVYTNLEWTTRESYYILEVGKIHLPVDPNTKDIMRIISQIDSLLSEATLECAYLKRKYQDLKTKMELSEKEAYVNFKQKITASVKAENDAIEKEEKELTLSGVKFKAKTKIIDKTTVNEYEGLVVKYLKTNLVYDMKFDIYTVLQSVEYRLIFIEAVVKMLSDKKMSIFADKAMIAIEAGISGSTNP